MRTVRVSAGNLRGRLALAAAAAAAIGVISAAVPSQAQPLDHAGVPGIHPVAARAPKADTSQQCFYTFPDCTSSSPQVTFALHSDGDTSACTFQESVDWGDGTTSVQAFAGGPDGTIVATFEHTYAGKPGTYPVTLAGETTAGLCGAASATMHFTLACTTSYTSPGDWDTATAPSPTPAIKPWVEPLNVIISACSNVTIGDIESALPGWFTVTDQIIDFKHLAYHCLSRETADVTGGGFAPPEESWRLGGCIGGNILSLAGAENHARLWNQPVAGSTDGAWFITASYETACVNYAGKMVPYTTLHGFFFGRDLFHCVNGGNGSYGSNGYDNGAAALAASIAAAAAGEGWTVSSQTITRPYENGHHTGEAGAPFSNNVIVVTVTQPPSA